MIPTATSCTSMLGAEPDLQPRPRSVDLDPVGVGFPAWHFAMVNDGARNAAIQRAIRALDLAGRTVVEVGTGTGVVALLFAEHGATRVVSCESHPVLARVARRTIDATPYGDRITIVQGSASEAIDQGLLPFAPDVIFIETLGCGVVGEGFKAIARDIGRIAGPHTTIVPKVVRQYAMLIDSAEVATLNRGRVRVRVRPTGGQRLLHGRLLSGAHRPAPAPRPQRVAADTQTPLPRRSTGRTGPLPRQPSWHRPRPRELVRGGPGRSDDHQRAVRQRSLAPSLPSIAHGPPGRRRTGPGCRHRRPRSRHRECAVTGSSAPRCKSAPTTLWEEGVSGAGPEWLRSPRAVGFRVRFAAEIADVQRSALGVTSSPPA